MATARRKTVERSARYTGHFVAPHAVELRPRVTSTVRARLFHPGQPVRRGEVLFRLDDRAFRARLSEAVAARNRARAMLAYKQAQTARLAKLGEKGYVARQDLDQGTRDLGQARADLAAAEASIRSERLNLRFASVRAPFAGTTGLTDVNVGALVEKDKTSLVRLTQVDPIDVQVDVTPQDAARLRAALHDGQAVPAQLINSEGHSVGPAGELHALDNSARQASGQLRLRVRFANGEGRFAPGDFARVKLMLGHVDRLLVPTRALSSRLDQRIVYVIEDGKAHAREVTTGTVVGENTAIVKGLSEHDRVAVDHLGRLHSGDRVRVVGDDDEHAADASATRNSDDADDARVGHGAS